MSNSRVESLGRPLKLWIIEEKLSSIVPKLLYARYSFKYSSLWFLFNRFSRYKRLVLFSPRLQEFIFKYRNFKEFRRLNPLYSYFMLLIFSPNLLKLKFNSSSVNYDKKLIDFDKYCMFSSCKCNSLKARSRVNFLRETKFDNPWYRFFKFIWFRPNSV